MSVLVGEKERVRLETLWAAQIPSEEWALYEGVIEAATAEGLPFMLGGGFAMAAYTGRWRNTKDLDFYIFPKDRERMIALLDRRGFTDYFDRLPYQRHWIYRATRDDVLVDTIWQMANSRAEVDESWFAGATTLVVRGRQLPILGPVEFVWAKLYVLQRDRCDWPDLFNVFYKSGRTLDWERLLNRLEEDAPLLAGALAVFGWLAPRQAGDLPEWLWERLGLRPPSPGPAVTDGHRRVELLDTRNWFGPTLPPGVLLGV